MPLPDSAFHFGERFVGKVINMNPCKIENRGADAQQHPWMDGYEITIGQDYPPSGTNRSIRFTASQSRRSKWGIWVSFWQQAGIRFDNKILGLRCLFYIKEHVWSMPDGDIAIELPAPVCTISDEELDFITRNRVDLATVDVDAILAAGNFYAGLTQPDGASSAAHAMSDGTGSGLTPPFEESEKDRNLRIYESLLTLLQEAGGALDYNQFVVKVLTDPSLAGDEAIKDVVTSKERLKEIGFGFDDAGQVLPF